jgi:predicted PhzF superfamily epimerase YddE/YHI9
MVPMSEVEVHVLRVFTAPDGSWGNALGVFLDGGAVPEVVRQQVAAELGFSETVYVDDASAGRVRIFTPAAELPFAGHPLVGTAWLLAHEGTPVDVLRPPAGVVPVHADGDLVWITARAEHAPEMRLLQMRHPDEVDTFAGAPPGSGVLYVWAWEDQDPVAGWVRARMFAPALGIDEDEATGAAAVRLGSVVGRPFVIRQGRGSELHVRPGDDGTVQVGGRCAGLEQRAVEVPQA